MADGMHEPDRFAPLPPIGERQPGPSEHEPEIWQPQLPAPQDLPETLHHSRLGAPSALWRYRDAAGALLFAVARFDTPGGKEVLPLSFGRRAWTTRAGNRRDHTGWHWKAAPEPRPLYGLNLLAARPDAPVLVVEGEKKVGPATALFPGYVAIAWPGGSGAVRKADWSPLAGRAVTIWPDHDTPGQKAAQAVAEAAHAAGASSVAIVAVPDAWPASWDLADPLPDGVSAEMLAAMIESASLVGGEAEPEADPLDAAAEIARLAGLSPVDYEVGKRRVAQQLGMTLAALDKAVRRERAQQRADAAAEHRAQSAPAPGEVRWPFGIFSSETGLHADAGDAGLVWLCAPLEVLGEARDAAGEGWGLWLRWLDRDGRAHTWPMPARLLMTAPGELEAALVERGLRVATDPAARMMLRRALGEVQAGSRVTLAHRAGWHATAYLRPDGAVIGAYPETLVMRTPAENAAQLVAVAGTLRDWQDKVASLAEGNSLAVFCLSASFVGPLLEPLGEASGGVHIFGRSRAGKTLCARLSCSVWGLPSKGGMLGSWSGTANSFEATAERLSDSVVVLDEMGESDPKTPSSIMYLFGNDSGKARLDRNAVARRVRTFRCFVVSTGEIDIESHVARGGQKLAAGAQTRLPSVPIPAAGGWLNLHGRASVEALMADLHTAVRLNHGTAAPLFLQHLAQERQQPEGLHATADLIRTEFAKLLPAGADQQVKDVCRRFALIALAGEMATYWRVLPWAEGEAKKAAKELFTGWLARRGSSASTEEAQQVRAIRLFLIEHSASRFVTLHYDRQDGWYDPNPERVVVRRAGWRRKQSDGRFEYVIPADVWREVCADAGTEPAETARTLAAGGYLNLGDGKNLARSVRLPGLGKVRCYSIHPKLLGKLEQEGGEDAEAENGKEMPF
jgi:putative DNA primase/helicase